MKLKYLLGCFLVISILLDAHAGIPVWTFAPLTPTTIIVPENGSSMVRYRITNQSNRPHTLQMQSIAGVTQITGNGFCGNPFSFSYKGASCVLSLRVTGNQLLTDVVDGPIVCQQGSKNQCYRPGPTDVLHIVRGSPEDMTTIAVTGSPLALIAGDGSSTMTITNTSTENTATNVMSDFMGTALEGKVTETGNTCTSIPAGGSCTLTFTPGATTVPQTNFTIRGTNTNNLTAAISIVTLGDSAGGGIVACINGGLFNLIAASTDNSSSIVWGGFGTVTNAQSDTDGSSNTELIVNALGNNGGIPYAAQLCADYQIDSQGNTPCQPGNTCYDDWFFPAKDQLACLDTNRVIIGMDNGNPYWSSTESTLLPANEAWAQFFMFNPGPQATASKSFPAYVRCTRSFG